MGILEEGRGWRLEENGFDGLAKITTKNPFRATAVSASTPVMQSTCSREAESSLSRLVFLAVVPIFVSGGPLLGTQSSTKRQANN